MKTGELENGFFFQQPRRHPLYSFSPPFHSHYGCDDNDDDSFSALSLSSILSLPTAAATAQQ